MFAADFTRRTLGSGTVPGPWRRSGPADASHRRAGLRDNTGLRPERIVDVEATAAQLLESRDRAARRPPRKNPTCQGPPGRRRC